MKNAGEVSSKYPLLYKLSQKRDAVGTNLARRDELRRLLEDLGHACGTATSFSNNRSWGVSVGIFSPCPPEQGFGKNCSKYPVLNLLYQTASIAEGDLEAARKELLALFSDLHVWCIKAEDKILDTYDRAFKQIRAKEKSEKRRKTV